MLSSHSWWKWSEPTRSSTSGSALVRVSRNASTLRDPLRRERRRLLGRGGARLVVEGVVRRGDHCRQLRHRPLLTRRRLDGSSTGLDARAGRCPGTCPSRSGRRRSSASWPSRPAARASSAKPRSMSTGRPRSASAAPHTPAPLSGSGGRAPAGAPGRSPRRAAGAVRADPPPRRSRAARGVRGSVHLVHGVAEAGDVPAAGAGLSDDVERERVPAGVVGRQRAVLRGERVGEEPAGVLGDAEEPGAAAEQAGGERALERVGRGQVGEPGGDRGRA